MYFYNYGPLNPSLMPNKDTFWWLFPSLRKSFIIYSGEGGKKCVKSLWHEWNGKYLSSSSSVAQVRKRIISWGNKVVIIPFWSTGVPLLTDRLMQAMVWGGWVEKGTFTDANLSPPHTNALCNASTFSKGSRVPYHWLCSQLACNSSLHRLLHRPTQWSLVFFFFKYWITTSFHHCSCVVWSRRCQQRSSEG